MKRYGRALWQITLYHFRELYRNKIALFFNLVFPLVMVVLFGSLFGNPDPSNALSSGRTVFDYLIPGQMTVMLLAAGMITTSVNLAAQRASGAMRHLFSTPLPVSVWTAGRLVASILMSVVQAIVLFSFAYVVYNVAPPANLAGTVIVMLLCTFASLGFGLIVGTLVRGEEAALAVTMPVFMVLLFFGNAAMPLENPPPFVEAILPFVPTYHMTEALRAVIIDGLSFTAAGRELAVLGGLSVALIGASLLQMRRQFV